MNKKITKCRVCGNKNIKRVGSFGEQYITNFSAKIDKKLPKCPLNLMWCSECKLLQLEHTANFDQLYRKYWYVSGVNQTMRDDLADVTSCVETIIKLKKGDTVVDIGSNDSTLLRSYKTKGLLRIGFEPAKNLMDKARGKGLTIINNFFSKKVKNAKAITACAMFYDLNDPNKFVKDMKESLADNGIIVIQLNHIRPMFERKTFDNISLEHLEYYSLLSIENLFNRHGLEVFDLQFNEVNGGSMRVWLKKKENKEQPVNIVWINYIRSLERELGLHTVKPYLKFVKESNDIMDTIRSFMNSSRISGKKITIYGASTRGNALLQACRVNSLMIHDAADRNPMKLGKFMVGTWIHIISEEEMRKDKPDYLLVLPWQFIDEMLIREKEYLEGGGKMVVFFPKFKVYEK